ncbi:MAG: DUF3291 domain-containing protein [Azospirillaceae bacterium]
MARRLAFYTFSILRAPYGDPAVQEFDDRTPDVFAEAERMPGFIDRARPEPDIPWASNFEKNWGDWGPFAVPRFYLDGTAPGNTRQAQTLSIWTDLEAVRAFAYRGPLHRAALRDRKAWFADQGQPTYCMWWIEADEQPVWRDAARRLEHLADHGPTPVSFDFKRTFTADDRPTVASVA